MTRVRQSDYAITQLLLYDTNHPRKIVHVRLRQAYVLCAETQSGRHSVPCRLQPKVADAFAPGEPVPTAHRVSHRRQTFHQRVDLLVAKNDGFRPAPPGGAEFHKALIVRSGVDSCIHVLVLSSLMKKERQRRTLLVSNKGLVGQQVQKSEGCGSSSVIGFSILILEVAATAAAASADLDRLCLVAIVE